MKRAGSFAAIVLIVVAATALFYLMLHQVSSLWLDVALRPEVRAELQKSLADQKRLRAFDRAHEELYRVRFEETRKLINRIDVIRMNRQAMLHRFELALVGSFAFVVAIGAAMSWSRARRAEARQRADYVARFASWQESARRHAHEIRTPLTAARLEVDRLVTLTRSAAEPAELERATHSVFEELDRLARFTREFSSFAAVAQPVLRDEDLNHVIEEFCATFANAWPDLELRFARGAAVVVSVDRDMLRQVLVNLCSNSARATKGKGSVTFAIGRDRARAFVDVSDEGGGIAESVRARVFDPYVTTNRVGEGMGLGLAISRKIMLDHGGDLELLATSPRGTTFRLTLQR